MMETAKTVTDSIIIGRKSSLLAVTDDMPLFVVDNEYEDIFSFNCGNGFLYTDSKHGENPFSGIETVTEIESANVLWACNYTGAIQDKADVGEILGMLRAGRLRYLERCTDSIATDCVVKDSGFTYSIVSSGSYALLSQTETIIFQDTILYSRIANSRYKVDIPRAP